MGFLDYAWSLSFQEDKVKTRIRVDPKLRQPTLTRNEAGFNITLPMPSMSEEETISFLGYEFPADHGKAKAGRLFRACVFHLTTHTLIPIDYKNTVSSSSKRTLVESFSESLVNDTYVNAYISLKHHDKLADLAFANSLAFAKMKPAERIFNPATRIMAALLSKINIGIVKGALRPKEENAVNQLAIKLSSLKQKIITSLTGKETELSEVFNETKNDITQILESHGPILEAPSLQHTEQIGPCTVFSQYEIPSEIEKIFKKSLETLSGINPSKEPIDSYWGKEVDAEASQAFDSWTHQRAREKKILTRIEKYVEGTKFKSIEFPEEDYTQYQRARALLRGGSRRLLDSLRVAQDALDEDPRKEMGQLDMPEVIQKIASRSPRTDVFVQNEYLSSSFAWGVLFDVSASMKIKGELSRTLAICVAEATKELLMDPGSWTFFAFSDRFYILKGASEAYSRRVRARIGGLKFDGLTYMPDAIRVAGKILARRFDAQRFLLVLSDGWPYGYPNMSSALSESISSLEKKGVIIIGVGLESERMKNFFKISSAVYSQKDLIKKFAKIYIQASAAALER
ncbi:MAG: hypothetical protein OEY24_02810 [Candidatus Bathyarchaeota archaeon]|nr:hypothetical protein [Candidatus Bathyarchaeota archaeon]MDH5494620.1 hypothetical protein [Candidatus Bathyarchaeota archaeon]